MEIPEEIIKKLPTAKHIALLTGAGVSAESGIPTFRDELTALWENFDAEELARSRAFRNDPALVWGWYEWRRMNEDAAYSTQPSASSDCQIGNLGTSSILNYPKRR